jgi:hypothetical protein
MGKRQPVWRQNRKVF